MRRLRAFIWCCFRSACSPSVWATRTTFFVHGCARSLVLPLIFLFALFFLGFGGVFCFVRLACSLFFCVDVFCVAGFIMCALVCAVLLWRSRSAFVWSCQTKQKPPWQTTGAVKLLLSWLRGRNQGWQLHLKSFCNDGTDDVCVVRQSQQRRLGNIILNGRPYLRIGEEF